MDDPPCRREYRSARVSEKNAIRLKLGVGLLAPAAGAAALVWDMATDEEAPVAVPIATGALCAAVLVFAFVVVDRALAAATISDEHGLTVQGMFRTRSTAWPDVHGIEVEDVSTAVETSSRRGVVLYDAVGGRYVLPYLDDTTLTLADLDGEAAFLRGVWLRRRGEGWEPRHDVVAGAASRTVSRDELVQRWLMLLLTALLVFFAGLVIMLGALVAGVYAPIGAPELHPVVEALLHPAALLGGLPAVYVVGYVLLLRRTGQAGKNGRR